LIRARKRGAESALLILVFRSDARCFTPNSETDPEFSRIYYQALEAGVKVHPLLFKYEDNALYFLGDLPLCRDNSV
jgi:sugar fermentation stimulation protein A